MARFYHAVCCQTCQHGLYVLDAENLAGAINSGQKFLREQGQVGPRRGIQTIVAIPASLGRAFAEMAEQHCAAAVAGFDQSGQRR